MEHDRSSPPRLRFDSTGVKLDYPAESLSVRLDSCGLWCSMALAGSHYYRCLDGTVVEGRRSPRVLSQQEAEYCLVKLQQSLARLFETPEHLATLTTKSAAIATLKKAFQNSVEVYQHQAEQYRHVYLEPVPILPPDRYRDLVIQPAVGCPNSQCDFCAFYRNKSFRPLSPRELESHLSGVQQLLGGSDYRDGIFLGSANALALSNRRLLAVLEACRDNFGTPRRGIASFMDPYFMPRRALNDWQALRQAGLNQVVIGLETAVPELRRLLGKPAALGPLLASVEQLVQANIRVGLCVLIGAGGEDWHQAHLTETLDLLYKLPLGPADLIYLSPLKPHPEGWSEAKMAGQLAAFQQELGHNIAPKVCPYHIERFFLFLLTGGSVQSG